jgi:signal transduction histidine kinase
MDINECMRNIIIGWLPIFEQKNIHFKLDIPEDEILIKIDREAFERIINNLVQNAVSHSGATCINIGIEACEKGVFVGITDNGQGIQEAKLPFVFERLYKCDDALPREEAAGTCYYKRVCYSTWRNYNGNK